MGRLPGSEATRLSTVVVAVLKLVDDLRLDHRQYGVPLEVYVSKFAHMRFEPAGLTNDADIRTAKSIVDYIFRLMGKKFLTPDQQEELGILSPEVRARLTAR